MAANIIGISGLPAAIRFKRQYWPGLEDREYRISQGHDAAAALIVDGEIRAAAAEERFDLQKHSAAFPVGAVGYCLSQSGKSIEEIDEIAHAFDYTHYRPLYSLDPISSRLYDEVFSPAAFAGEVRRIWPDFPEERMVSVGHHLAHAASAYFTSGWEDCLVIVIDAMGETQSVTVYRGEGGELRKLREIPASDSIGILYSLVTLHLGFDFNSDEYKIMGLAPYGDPARFRPFFEQAVEKCPDGTIRIPVLRMNRTRDDRENYLTTRRYLNDKLLPERRPEDGITDTHRDVAAALQECLNETVLHICGYFGETTGWRRLAMAGGVALNCSANGRLMRSGLFDEVYVQPAAGDDGSALGAALYRASLRSRVESRRMPVPYLGPDYGAACLDAALRRFAGQLRTTHFATLEETCSAAASLIAEGRVIAWYRGRMEFGPRALGNRSILADAGNPEMRDRINAMVKKREAFRPFAPAVTVEQVDRWFDVPPGTELPYMIATVPVREQHRGELPAITHVDGTARVQTVSARDNAEFHALLKAVGGDRTGAGAQHQL